MDTSDQKASDILLDFIKSQEVLDSSGKVVTDLREKIKLLTNNSTNLDRALNDFQNDLTNTLNNSYNKSDLIVDNKLIKLSDDITDIVQNAQTISTSLIYFDCDLSSVKDICKSLRDLINKSDKLPKKKMLQFINRLEKCENPNDLKEIINEIKDFLETLLMSYAKCLDFIKSFLDINIDNIIKFFINLATGGQADVIKANAEIALMLGESTIVVKDILDSIKNQYIDRYNNMLNQLKNEILDAPDDLKNIAIARYFDKQRQLQDLLNVITI